MLENIRDNIEKLIAAYESVKVENISLKTEIGQYRNQVEGYRKQISELENQIDNLKLKGAFLGDAGSGNEAKVKIDRMIKEIDKCISLLEA
ncbi:MAG: DUF3450 domain-containing protein [Bacteroidales bacterium]|nr:DUF3450 domain-containing protein [Bacteroides sp.]MCM1198434.1 DUF3450 domain-containing protein [Clostridium sp.]MCM1502578.1 DUF3450 domain-containing protein [Bacteroidales bacterium]